MNVEIDMGENVVCDICGEDWTERTESGGFLFGSKAYCPDCAEDGLRRIRGYHEEHMIRAYCPSDKSFKDWVLSLRGGDNTIKIYTS